MASAICLRQALCTHKNATFGLRPVDGREIALPILFLVFRHKSYQLLLDVVGL